MLAPEGLVSLDTFSSCFKSGDFSALSGELGESLKGAIEEANALEKEVSGAQIGVIFDRAMYAYLLAACKKNSALKKMVREKIDMTNILSVLRSEDEAQAEKYYITGGKVSFEKLVSLLGDDVASDFSYAVSPDFFKAAISAKRKKLPMTEAEKLKDSCEYDYLNKNKYELKKSQPFLYYVFRRRLENENVRIIFVCLLSGMSEREIKARLRAI
jgi:vacuolar-type H+-ATPase subunit C/Vma6